MAGWFEVSLPTVEAWVRKGCPVVQRGSRGVPWVFDLLDVAKWRYARDVQAEPEGVVIPTDPESRDKWYASELKRLQYEAKTGQLLEAEEVRHTWSSMLKAIMLKLDTLQDVVERDAGLTPEQAQVIQEAIDTIREQAYQEIISE